MGTKLLLGFGGTVIQVEVHLLATGSEMLSRFGGTVNQAVVHQGTHEKILCRGFGKYRNSSGSSPRHLCRQDRNRFRRYRKSVSSSPQGQG